MYIMIELLNEKSPEDISFNIMKYMSHPLADIIKEERLNVRCNCKEYKLIKPFKDLNQH